MITRSKLKQLSENCAKLLFCSEVMEGSNTSELMESNKIIKQALRKIIIANEISDRMIICVTGLQGTGKTSLMKNYFEIDDSIMNISIGRGERLPVFITESDVKQPEMYAVGIEKNNNGYSQVKKKVSQSEFIEYSKAEDDDSTIMFMELLVPWKYDNNMSKISYMLLPGYEKNDSYWNTLIEFSVKCSDTAIFVLTPESVAGAANAALLEKINEQFGENVIYAISHSDEKSDNNDGIKKTLMELVGANEGDQKRFVCTGAYTNKDKNVEWKKQLRTAIELYSARPITVDQKNIEYIEEIIFTELRPAVVTIKKFVTDVTEELLTGFQQSTWLTSFDQATAKMRKKFQKVLSDNFEKAQAEDRNDLLDILENGRKTFSNTDDEKDITSRVRKILDSGKNKASYLKRSIFGESLKDVKKSKEIIDEVMKNQNGEYRYQLAFCDAIIKCTDSICNKTTVDNVPQIGETSLVRNSLISKQEKERKLILQDISTILNSTEKKGELVSADPRDTMRAIVECGTQYFGLCMINELYSEQYITVPELSESNLTKSEIMESIKDSEKFAYTVLGITGLDLLGDGVINFIPSLASSLGVSLPVAGTITALFVGAGAAKALIKDYNKIQMKDFYSYKKAIESVYDDVENKYMEIYDDYIAEIRARVENYLIECIGANDVIVNKQNALINIKNIQKDLDSIRKELKEDSYEITKLIKG